MGKKEEFYRGYSAGLMTAKEIAEKNGIEGIEEEIRFRGTLKIEIPLTKKEVNCALTETAGVMIQTIGIVACMALRNEFDFGKKRLDKFLDRFRLDAESLMSDEVVTWEDYIDTILKETGVNLREMWDERFLERIGETR